MKEPPARGLSDTTSGGPTGGYGQAASALLNAGVLVIETPTVKA